MEDETKALLREIRDDLQFIKVMLAQQFPELTWDEFSRYTQRDALHKLKRLEGRYKGTNPVDPGSPDMP